MQFFTATCLYWQMLLARDEHKQIVMNSLKFLVEDSRIWLYGFVLMPNHIHLMWRKKDQWLGKNVQQMFLKYTAQQIKFSLADRNDSNLEYYRRAQKDRKYHFWERRAYAATMHNRLVAKQKIDYIHRNPVKACLCNKPEDYHYSSARFYGSGIDDWGIITNYTEHL